MCMRGWFRYIRTNECLVLRVYFAALNDETGEKRQEEAKFHSKAFYFFWRLEICDTIIGSRATIASLNTFML